MNSTPGKSRLDLIRGLPFDLQIEIVENEFRKEWTESEKYEIAQILRKQLEKTKEQGKRTDLASPTFAKHLAKVIKNNSDNYRINEEIGKVFKESHETIRKRDKVFEAIDDTTKKALDSGEKSLHSTYQKTISKENAKKPSPPLPIGKFNHIVEDPGWYFGNQNIGGSGKSGAAFHYKTEPTNVIARIPIHSIAADNAVLYMWSTNQHLITGSMLMSEYYEILHEQKLEILCKKTTNQDKIKKLKEQTKADNELVSDILKNEKVQSDALSVMHCHGFTPKCIITWEKEEKNGWNGYWLKNVTEQLIIGIRGEIAAFGLSEETIIKSKYIPKSHSKKPKVAWELIEKCVSVTKGNHRKLEMNCRTPREGWHPHGDAITTQDIKTWQKK